jgi:hypothetical protein
MIEGSGSGSRAGSGSIPLTSGSGSGCQKHVDPMDSDPDPQHWIHLSTCSLHELLAFHPLCSLGRLWSGCFVSVIATFNLVIIKHTRAGISVLFCKVAFNIKSVKGEPYKNFLIVIGLRSGFRWVGGSGSEFWIRNTRRPKQPT